MANILVCDDEENIVETIKDILSDEGHRVFVSNSGNGGLKICKENKIDLAIVDIWMPVMNGIDLLKKIKNIDSSIEVIMISGHANVEMAVKSMKLGAFDFIEKPPSLRKLLSIVKRALDKKKS